MALVNPASIASIIYLNILILSIQGNPAFSDLPLHRQKNITRLKPLLNSESNNKIPEYEVVQLRILSKRSTDDQNIIRVHLSAFGKDIHLRLQRDDYSNDRSKNARLFEARLTDTGIQLTEVIIEDDDPGALYIDPVQMASVTIRHGSNGELEMDGVIGNELLIKPAPTDSSNLEDDYTYDWYFSNGSRNELYSSRKDKSSFFNFPSTTDKNAHIVYRRLVKTKTSFKVAFDNSLNNIHYTGDGRRHKRPLHVWPEVLLMVDYDTYAMHVSHGFNDTQIRRYYVSFLNGVDLRFKILSDPQISLVLSQIIIFKSRDALPYLHKYLNLGLNTFEGYEALDDLASHVYSLKIQQPDNFPEFDVAVLLTNLDMCTQNPTHTYENCTPYTIGLAYFTGACKVNHYTKSWKGVAIVEDNGGFDGILTAAHEIGHLLGAKDDEDPDPLIDPQYTSFCSNDDGYLMSSKLTSNRIFQWSECSIKQIRQFLSSDRASCLFNQPSYQNDLEGSELPGAVLSLDEQCKRFWGTRASAWDSRVCFSLHCHRPINQDIDIRHLHFNLPPAAEGSSCGEDLHCRHGKCVSKYLTYGQAWNMVPVHDRLKYIYSTTVTTTKKPALFEKDCTDKEEFFCETYFWTIRSKEACKNSRILEECCYSHRKFCSV